ncbi:hypothetical protein ACN38_g2926 [Penicillium nordicum]|uniref:Uncharacterized protein n=1 Tax=Penicillium nordicum TaxID=229535 RepID=A0A0M8P605_9EURO|nr:hypothetical protein ACN38_g2926 [Penicillium nordicum]
MRGRHSPLDAKDIAGYGYAGRNRLCLSGFKGKKRTQNTPLCILTGCTGKNQVPWTTSLDLQAQWSGSKFPDNSGTTLTSSGPKHCVPWHTLPQATASADNLPIATVAWLSQRHITTFSLVDLVDFILLSGCQRVPLEMRSRHRVHGILLYFEVFFFFTFFFFFRFFSFSTFHLSLFLPLHLFFFSLFHLS